MREGASQNMDGESTAANAGAAPSAESPPGLEARTRSDAVETPSGKGAGDENFPVGSALIAKELRPTVARYYAFARAADDVADNPDLAPDDKIARLDAFEIGLDDPNRGPEKSHRLAEALRARGIDDAHARDLLVAFRQDALKTRYESWDELIGYCEVSANPVGRFLLDLHGESRAVWPASDALCTVLQILNHLQDLGDDLRNLDRVYAPRDYLAAEGLDVEILRAPKSPPALRRVIDRMLDGCDALLAVSRPLARRLKSRRMAAETAVIQNLAERLAARLRREDPLTGRVKLSKLDFAAAALIGGFGALVSSGPARARAAADAEARSAAREETLDALRPRALDLDPRRYAEAVVTRSGTSFAAGMKILAKPRREGMFAVYAFCRLVDDIADGPFSAEEKRAALTEWRAEIDRLYESRPLSPTGRALIEPVARFDLPREEFILMIEGMEMDADGPIVAPTRERLAAYTRRVAGAVGVLSMRVFGAWTGAPSERFALSLADALQLTNILRDVEEDAAIGRVYLPREALEREGVGYDPAARLSTPAAGDQGEAMRRVCAELGAEARACFDAARAEIPAHRRVALAPALMMMGAYERYLDMLEARDWRRPEATLKISGKRKLWLGLARLIAPRARPKPLPKPLAPPAETRA